MSPSFVKKSPKTPLPALARSLGVLLALGIGGTLIQRHTTLNQTLLGTLLGGVAVFLFSGFWADVPGLPVFSQAGLRAFKGKKEWDWKWSFLGGIVIFGLLKLSDLSLQKSWWLVLVLSMGLLGWGLNLLEEGSSAFWTPPDKKSGWWDRFPWPELLVILLGFFFLFYRLADIPQHIYPDSMWSIQEARQFSVGAYKTPYTTEWDGFPMMPLMLMGLVFKVIGVSLFKGVAFYAILNLIGILFFYGFLRFYLSPGSALAGALLYGASHWVNDVARMPFLGVSILLPFEAAALFFFARALEKGKRGDYLWFGISLSICLQTYLPSRFLPAYFLAALVIFWFFRPKEMSRQKTAWALGLGTCLLGYLPMIFYYFQNKNNLLGFNARVSQVNLLPMLIHQRDLSPLWGNIAWVLRAFTVTAGNNPIFSLSNFPLLSPWESLCLLAGIGWCLGRFWKPASLFLTLGFFGSLLVPVMSYDPHVLRALATAPFTYILVGIGLDRLCRVVIAPLGFRVPLLPALFPLAVLVLSLSWQYDVYFRQIPNSKSIWTHDQGFEVLAGKTLAQYPPGWEIYVLPDEFFGFDFSVFSPNGQMGKLTPFYPKSALPLSAVPEKGAVVFLPDEFGRVFKDWMKFYYPDSNPKLVLNPFGDVQYWLWEIPPGQIQKALEAKWRRPPGGLRITCFDSQDRKLGQWLVPALFSNVNYWFREFQGKSVFPPSQAVRFTVEGFWSDPDSKPLALTARGPVKGKVGSRRINIKKGAVDQVRIPPIPAGGVPLQLNYVTLPNDFYMFLQQKDAEGWTFVGSDNLQPTEKTIPTPIPVVHP